MADEKEIKKAAPKKTEGSAPAAATKINNR